MTQENKSRTITRHDWDAEVYIDDTVLACFRKGTACAVIDVTPGDSYRHAVDDVIMRMTQLGYAEKDQFAVRLAIDEAYGSARKYGRPPLMIAYDVRPQETMIALLDNGDGFDPASVPNCLDPEHIGNPGGRGLYLMLMYMDRVTYSQKANCVQIIRTKGSTKPNTDPP